MKNLLLIAITILAVGCGEKDKSTIKTTPPEIKKEALPKTRIKLPKSFVLDLWSQPNDETKKSLKKVKSHVEKSGIWKIQERWDLIRNN